jgi:hypothetical protein
MRTAKAKVVIYKPNDGETAVFTQGEQSPFGLVVRITFPDDGSSSYVMVEFADNEDTTRVARAKWYSGMPFIFTMEYEDDIRD